MKQLMQSLSNEKLVKKTLRLFTEKQLEQNTAFCYFEKGHICRVFLNISDTIVCLGWLVPLTTSDNNLVIS